MRKLVLVIALAACCLSMSGCLSFDRQHNRMRWEVIKRDTRMGSDDDWILALDEESPLDTYYR